MYVNLVARHNYWYCHCPSIWISHQTMKIHHIHPCTMYILHTCSAHRKCTVNVNVIFFNLIHIFHCIFSYALNKLNAQSITVTFNPIWRVESDGRHSVIFSYFFLLKKWDFLSNMSYMYLKWKKNMNNNSLWFLWARELIPNF